MICPSCNGDGIFIHADHKGFENCLVCDGKGYAKMPDPTYFIEVYKWKDDNIIHQTDCIHIIHSASSTRFNLNNSSLLEIIAIFKIKAKQNVS